MPTAIVTGGSRGLGLALTRLLVRRGWTAVVDARDAAALERAASELRSFSSAGATVTKVAGDVTDPEHRRALVRAAVGSGGLDAVVNNAGAVVGG